MSDFYWVIETQTESAMLPGTCLLIHGGAILKPLMTSLHFVANTCI